MKGSTVILVLVTLGLIVAQTLVEAASCCPTAIDRNCFAVCRGASSRTISRETCANSCGCKIVPGKKCPPGYPDLVFALDEEQGLKDSSTIASAPSDIIRFCKIGCTSSMCFRTTTPQNSADRVGEDEEFVRCNKACSYVCTKGADAGLTA
ncbi:hypothetical protein ACHQM5_025339 [Ranunculus cassubicifolius]